MKQVIDRENQQWVRLIEPRNSLSPSEASTPFAWLRLVGKHHAIYGMKSVPWSEALD